MEIWKKVLVDCHKACMMYDNGDTDCNNFCEYDAQAQNKENFAKN